MLFFKIKMGVRRLLLTQVDLVLFSLKQQIIKLQIFTINVGKNLPLFQPPAPEAIYSAKQSNDLQPF
jgi:hypothetical protein